MSIFVSLIYLFYFVCEKPEKGPNIPIKFWRKIAIYMGVLMEKKEVQQCTV